MSVNIIYHFYNWHTKVNIIDNKIKFLGSQLDSLPLC